MALEPELCLSTPTITTVTPALLLARLDQLKEVYANLILKPNLKIAAQVSGTCCP